MSVNAFTQPSKGFGGEPRSVRFSFAPNGTSNPVVSSNQGPPGLKSTPITYSATGVYTLVFPADFGFPADATFAVSAQCASLAAYFEAVQLGAYTASTRTLVVQAKQGASGVAVAADPNARIHIVIHFNDSQGG